jgi:signal transduction histidine kinase
VAEEASAAARIRAPSRRIELLARGAPAPVLADRLRLLQVLTNLLDNALKYSPDGTPVTVEVNEVDGGVRLVVRDRGPGIPPAERERVFEKFHRLDAQMSGGVGGSGLGLYIAAGLVRAMRGRMWIEATAVDAIGTVVVVELPKSELPLVAGARTAS